MNRYFSTFITGFQEVVEAELKKILPDVKILRLFDGLVIYETIVSIQDIQKLRFVNNSYIWLSQSTFLKGQKPERLIEQLLRMSDFNRSREAISLKFVKFFRVIVSKENETISVDRQLLEKAERKIFYSTHLKVHRTLPDIEYWFIFRKEGISLFGARVTPLGKETTRKYDKGELRQELAHLLVLLSDPQKEDVVLDPFAGSGAIVLERVQTFPYSRIFASDIKECLVEDLKRKTKWGQQKIIVEKHDALNLDNLEINSINKIITDPPWGLFEKPQEDMVDFYRKMLTEFDRVLEPNGTMVVLLGRDSGFDKALFELNFKTDKKIDILVSGQKASIYRLK